MTITINGSGTITGATTLASTVTSPTLTSPTISGAVVSAMASSVITSGTAVASTSGTSIDFTSIPSWVKRITVQFAGISVSGTSGILVRLGYSGGVEATGYASGAAYTGTSSGGTTNTTGLLANFGASAADISHGTCTISLVNPATNLWVSSSACAFSTSNYASVCGGSKTLSGTLTQIRITTINGTDTFDAGSINILYE
jgi:hypothetical protein